MDFETPLIPARLLRRYKRFLADAELEDGREITAHIANPGAMLGHKEPGLKIWLEPNNNPKRKLKFAWRLVEDAAGAFTGVDTSLPNRIVKEALQARKIPELKNYATFRSEVKYGENSRIDFLLSEEDTEIYLEVKSVTLMRQAGLAEFPDSVTKRGAKHLDELADMVKQGHRAIMFYLVQRTDARSVTLAQDIDPTYAEAFDRAMDTGVEVLAYDCDITPKSITLGRRLSFHR